MHVLTVIILNLNLGNTYNQWIVLWTSLLDWTAEHDYWILICSYHYFYPINCGFINCLMVHCMLVHVHECTMHKVHRCICIMNYVHPVRSQQPLAIASMFKEHKKY